MDQSKPFLAIDENGNTFKASMSFTPIDVNMDDHIRKIADKAEITTKIDKDLWLAIKGDRAKAAKRIYELPIKTDYIAKDGLTKITPSFRPRTTSVFSECIIHVPESMILLFISSNNRCYLVAVSKEKKQLYRLPLPNLYDTGQVCMGHSADGVNDKPLSHLEKFDKMVEVMLNASWNTDLIGGSSQSSRDAMWNWDLESKEYLGMPENWEKHCNVVSDDSYNDLCKFVMEN